MGNITNDMYQKQQFMKQSQKKYLRDMEIYTAECINFVYSCQGFTQKRRITINIMEIMGLYENQILYTSGNRQGSESLELRVGRLQKKPLIHSCEALAQKQVGACKEI